MKESKTQALSRRRVFAAGGTVGALAAAAAVLPLATRSDEPAGPAAAKAADQGGGYRVTQHVLRYYQTAKV